MTIYIDYISHFGVPIALMLVALQAASQKVLKNIGVLLIGLIIVLSFNAFEDNQDWFGDEYCENCDFDRH